MAKPSTRAPEAGVDPNARPLPTHLGFASGLMMGTADAIPGVSGGTIALIIGVYERFIAALAAVVRAPTALRDLEARAELWRALRLLVPLGAGVVVAYYMATKLLVGPEDAPGIIRRPDTAPFAYAFFFGLVLVSLREPWRRIAARPRALHFGVAAITAIAAAVFVGLPHQAGEPPLIALLFGGAAAISVMLLPGVSGSLLLVILGQYAVVAGAVHDRNLAVIAIFLLGIAIGVITFVPFLRYLLRTAHDVTMAALTGLMAGSLRALWPWKEGYEPKESMANVGIGDDLLLVLVAAGCGGLVVWLLARLERHMSRASAAGQPDPEG
jgi:putative membrane protein